MVVYIDWSRKKPFAVKVGKEIKSIKTSEISEFLKNLKEKEDTIVMEASCPKTRLYSIIDSGFKIYLCNTDFLKKTKGVKSPSDEDSVGMIEEGFKKYPEKFRLLTKLEKEEIEKVATIKKYIHFVKDSVRFQLRQLAYDLEYGEKDVYKEILEILKGKRKNYLKLIKPLFKEEISIFDDIKGVGPVTVAQLLCVAHPKKFKNVGRFLAYCGYKERSWRNGTNKYDRLAKTTGWLMSNGVIRAKDEKYYPLYLEIKEALRKKYPEYSKGKTNGMAICRLSTLILKEIYHRLHGDV